MTSSSKVIIYKELPPIIQQRLCKFIIENNIKFTKVMNESCYTADISIENIPMERMEKNTSEEETKNVEWNIISQTKKERLKQPKNKPSYTWLSNMIEHVYMMCFDEYASIENEIKKVAKTSLMSYLVKSIEIKSEGKDCEDILYEFSYAMEIYKNMPIVKIFREFLDEIYSTTTLFFFLCVKHMTESYLNKRLDEGKAGLNFWLSAKEISQLSKIIFSNFDLTFYMQLRFEIRQFFNNNYPSRSETTFLYLSEWYEILIKSHVKQNEQTEKKSIHTYLMESGLDFPSTISRTEKAEQKRMSKAYSVSDIQKESPVPSKALAPTRSERIHKKLTTTKH